MAVLVDVEGHTEALDRTQLKGVPCVTYVPTVRQRALLRRHALNNADLAYGDIYQFGDTPVGGNGKWHLFDRLPAITFGQSTEWRKQMARSFEDIADDLLCAEAIEIRSLAEYVAISISIDDAHADYASNSSDQETAELSVSPRDFDWASLTESVIFDPQIGTLAIYSAVHQYSVDDWFRVPGDRQPRDPDRGFARYRVG